MIYAFKILCLFVGSLFPKPALLPVAGRTWEYFEKVTYESGLPDDRIDTAGEEISLPDRTSPTNIGLYLFSISCARNLEIIEPKEAERRIGQTMKMLTRMDRCHGFYFNWYIASTGDRLYEWSPGLPLPQFLSSIDNAWIASALMHVQREYPGHAAGAKAILAVMDFRFFYDTKEEFFYGGYDCGSGEYTGYHYGILNSETRMISYVAIKSGQVQKSHLHKLIKVKRDDRLVSSYGSMFEALVVPLFVPENEDSPRWKDELIRYAQYHIDNGYLGFWGVSYSDDTRGVYKEFGLEKLSQYPAHFEGEGVVSPYASFLAIQTHPTLALANIQRLEAVCSGRYGFYGAYKPSSRQRSSSFLTLEQGVIMMSIADYNGKNPSKASFGDLVERNFP